MKPISITTAIALVLLAPNVVQAGQPSLPLKRGHYVAAGSDCHGAPSSAKTWFGGGFVIQSPHATCRLRSVSRQGSHHYVIAEQCYEYGDPTMPFSLVDHVTVASSTHYDRVNKFGRFDARWCRE